MVCLEFQCVQVLFQQKTSKLQLDKEGRKELFTSFLSVQGFFLSTGMPYI